MIKKILIVLAAPAIMVLASCNGSQTEEEIILPGMMKIQVPVAGDSLSMIVPDSSKGHLAIIEQPWGATEVKIGTEFNVSIESGEGDMALKKSDITGDDVYTLQRYIVDEPQLIFWEAKIGDLPNSNFHFYAITKPGKVSYVVKDVETGDAYTEQAIKAMVDAVKTLKAKATPAPEH